MNEVPWTWFVMRSSGLVAVGLLTVSVLLGLIGPRLRPTARLTSISVHRAASVAGTLLIVAHIVLALLDRWIVLDWPAALLPGVAGWERWGVALGALAGGPHDRRPGHDRDPDAQSAGSWRRAHLLAYPVWALAVGHGLLVGTDGAVMQALAMVSLAVVLFGFAVRLLVRPTTAARSAARPRRGRGSGDDRAPGWPAASVRVPRSPPHPVRARPRACRDSPFPGRLPGRLPRSCSPPARCSWPVLSPAGR